MPGLRKALGSDLWPNTWASDGNLYAAWGDGGGFDGNDDHVGRASLGFARISGTPVAGDRTSYVGKNVWGQAPAYAESQARFGGKIDAVVAIDGVLYAQGSVWTSANCHCRDPTQKNDDNPLQPAFMWSTDLAKTWHIAPWDDAFGSPLQFGQDYRGSLEPDYVYLYYQHDVNVDPTHIFLRRVLKSEFPDNPVTAGHFEYLTRVDAGGEPRWSSDPAQAAPVFFDPNVPPGVFAAPSVVYDAPLGRYLLASAHGALTGQIGFFEAPSPWGPWATVDYSDDWGGFNERAGLGNGLAIPAKWILDRGKTLWAVFSGVRTSFGEFDSFNLAKAVLTVSDAVPQITSPPPGSAFEPGQNVTARGTGSDLSWSVQRLNGARLQVAQGAGSYINFHVPDHSQAEQVIRITLTAAGVGSVYDDHAIQSSADNSLLGYWTFDTASGGTTADASGRNNTGRLVHNPQRVAGRYGDALRFSGDESVRIPGEGNLANLYRHGMTIAAWINPASAGTAAAGRIADKGEWFLRLTGDLSLRFAASQYGARGSAALIAANTWQHVAATWDGSRQATHIHLYIDGVPSDSVAVSGVGAPRRDSAVPFVIGNRADGARGFDGGIDEVRIYGRVLSASEIHTLASGGVNVAINRVSSGQTYRLATVQPGALLYTDANATLTSIPAEVAGGVMIQTASVDGQVTAPRHLTFRVDGNASVYVAYSTLSHQLPRWLDDGSWTATPLRLLASDSGNAASLALYRKAFPPGRVTLGGNLAMPATAAAYPNYCVIVVPLH